jgi:SAM-dependent methyltransferase
VSGALGPVATTAALHGPRWGARAADWAQYASGLSAPAWKAVADATGIGPGTRVLDIGCGSGEFCRLAAERGARASGIDAAEGMVEVARRLAPECDLRVGPMESLPWEDESFDVVTAFNALKFAADTGLAAAEARRVARAGGLVAVCVWGPREQNDLMRLTEALRGLQPPPPAGATPAPPGLGEPGALEELLRGAGLEPHSAAWVDIPFEASDRETLERAMMTPGGVLAIIESAGEAAVRAAIARAAAPFRRPDGSYRFENRFRYAVAGRP